MANNNQKNKKNSTKPQNSKGVILLKLIILFVIFAIPLFFMIADVTMNFFNLSLKEANQNINQPSQANLNEAKTPGKDFNFAVPLPAERTGDISNVSQEKKDSLFDNLK